MRAGRRTLAAVVAGLAAVLAACGGSEPPSVEGATDAKVPAGESTPAVGAAPSTVAATGACRYVTTEQAAAFAASPVKRGLGWKLATPPVTFEYCDYMFDPGTAPGVTVGVANLGGNAAERFAQFKRSKAAEPDHQTVSGIGDEAFFSGQSLSVRKGSRALVLYVGRSSGPPRGVGALPDEKRLAELVLPQL